jgi:hypothetical protein
LSSILWHKERLLNILLPLLPGQYTKIAWLDSDILFEDSAWFERASELLETRDVVQCFEDAYTMPTGVESPKMLGENWIGFMKMQCAENDFFEDAGRNHGHQGFAWAARRELLDGIGLYDACVLGGGDHMMAHAFVGDLSDHGCFGAEMKTPERIDHFMRWRQEIRLRMTRGFGYVPGAIFHLWQGELANRRYAERRDILARHAFDPLQDIEMLPNGTWHWASDKISLHQEVRQYFEERREDA